MANVRWSPSAGPVRYSKQGSASLKMWAGKGVLNRVGKEEQALVPEIQVATPEPTKQASEDTTEARGGKARQREPLRGGAEPERRPDKEELDKPAPDKEELDKPARNKEQGKEEQAKEEQAKEELDKPVRNKGE